MFKEKVVIVSGCSKGIGLEICQQYLAEGAKVYGIARSSVPEELQSNPNFTWLQGSISDSRFVLDSIATIKARDERIDILVNNAGINHDSLIQLMALEDWQKVLTTNLKGTFNLCQQVLPIFKAQQFGRIINMVSKSGVVGREGQINYATSKGAIIGMTRTIAREYGKDNILCNAVAPGLIETQMVDSAEQSIVAPIIDCTSVRRMGQCSEVARTVLHLTSDAPNYQNGEVIHLDGGFLI
ncbi:SDR family NAD(P)-dependent oxidoreductase [Pseudoalteromonas luteoviolacea]|uniref:3-oxoacyl-ACP reductase n=1 Tax=Pseudoalteromonas luteoviolacea H33 TaxID=1365251 RepID=A0A167DZU4_9GAMM|nr:SDR family NAD(P)-dependent oxidoreductase [Pseudoalteromonas luteoviolacea]KZN49809.1 hypothetical protein N476_18625 [Pseudoalteromonas luteoviolacea H33]KZN77833.1 hypothetical protein N477_01080 [Pseudoalteromonas luteoviolacea H33-S]MBQ4879461.1 SDR family oxidoreductase [Pseudoalteromonas luteoviolacea]MBQ4908521.1 SDR family oxidoreductase [Pseudoalteromonas luteoviolacea]